MAAGDPVTRVNKYWPISREQLSHANMDVLFPEDIAHNRKLRTTPFNLDELNAAFQFNPPFSPTNTQSTFGQAPQPIAQPIHHVPAPNSLASELMNQIVQRSDGTVTLQDLVGMNAQQLNQILRPECMQALQANPAVFTIQDLAGMNAQQLNQILRPECIQVLQANPPVFTIQDLAGMNAQQLNQILRPECMQALQNGQTTIEYLSTMNPSDLSRTIDSGDYPNHNHGLGAH